MLGNKKKFQMKQFKIKGFFGNCSRVYCGEISPNMEM